ncbi:hypothetical protein QTH97_13870 [Variovorax sp. J22R24]|uniref:DUF4124 domain-containing protein n=1 Tax=Variovorax gracilis TaxID=3053502 RepID=UPI0025771D93|nr:hypothetical protein [Variovorax sp. J22R24]MDM0106026.1 hypothetical protein [Variovorax sp. J22R24]
MLTLAGMPAFAMFKCIADGKTTFQELPCTAGARQTEIRSQYEAQEPEMAPTVAAPSTPTSDQLKLDSMESERLRREAAYALRDKLAEFTRYQASCERDHGVIFTRNADASRSITSAVYPQNVNDASANMAAARCIAKVNELQQQLGALRLQCAARKCE